MYLAKISGQDDQVILNTQWFTTEIIGSVFAGFQFEEQQRILRPQQLYTLSELQEIFTEEIEGTRLLALLDDMDLVHKTNDGKFLIPGKLPEKAEEVKWNVQDAYLVKGISIRCADDIDIFNPSVFPCVQKKILDVHREATVVSRTAIRCTLAASVDIFVQLTKHQDAINIAVRCDDEKSVKEAYGHLTDTVELIELELSEKSAGTNLRRCYISQEALRQADSLEDVWSFTEDDLVKAEKEDGMVRRDERTRPEDITKILFEGHDNILLRKLGPKCWVGWLPVDVMSDCFGRLDAKNEWLEDYTSVARLLGIPDFEMQRILDQSKIRDESVTHNLIKRWCEKNKKKMTIEMFRSVLDRLCLEDNADALKVIDRVIEKYPGKVSYTFFQQADHSDFDIKILCIQLLPEK